MNITSEDEGYQFSRVAQFQNMWRSCSDILYFAADSHFDLWTKNERTGQLHGKDDIKFAVAEYIVSCAQAGVAYKRLREQYQQYAEQLPPAESTPSREQSELPDWSGGGPVSYTHLTLPTILRV